MIFLSAKTTKTDQLKGFEAGGDDYITKPFDIENLVARTTALIKRSKKEAKIYKFRDILIDINTAKVKIGEEICDLTKLETELLLEFIKNKNITLSRDYLLTQIWNDNNTNPKTVNIAIKRLREKIDPFKTKGYIKSVRVEGYKLC